MFIFIAVLTAIVLLSIFLVPIEDDWTEYTRIVESRFERDQELREAREAFINVFGREPSYRELWMICPPLWMDEDVPLTN